MSTFSDYASAKAEVDRLFGEGMYEEAAAVLKDAVPLAAGPGERVEAYVHLATLYRLRGNTDAALEAVQRALTSANAAPHHEVQYLKGVVFRIRGGIWLDEHIIGSDPESLVSAESSFRLSLGMLSEGKSAAHLTQIKATRAAQARLAYISGDPKEAVKLFVALEREFTGTDEFELSERFINLLWLGRASAVYRWLYAPRMFRLSAGDPQNRKFVWRTLSGRKDLISLTAGTNHRAKAKKPA